MFTSSVKLYHRLFHAQKIITAKPVVIVNYENYHRKINKAMCVSQIASTFRQQVILQNYYLDYISITLRALTRIIKISKVYPRDEVLIFVRQNINPIIANINIECSSEYIKDLIVFFYHFYRSKFSQQPKQYKLVAQLLQKYLVYLDQNINQQQKHVNFLITTVKLSKFLLSPTYKGYLKKFIVLLNNEVYKLDDGMQYIHLIEMIQLFNLNQQEERQIIKIFCEKISKKQFFTYFSLPATIKTFICLKQIQIKIKQNPIQILLKLITQLENYIISNFKAIELAQVFSLNLFMFESNVICRIYKQLQHTFFNSINQLGQCSINPYFLIDIFGRLPNSIWRSVKNKSQFEQSFIKLLNLYIRDTTSQYYAIKSKISLSQIIKNRFFSWQTAQKLYQIQIYMQSNNINYLSYFQNQVRQLISSFKMLDWKTCHTSLLSLLKSMKAIYQIVASKQGKSNSSKVSKECLVFEQFFHEMTLILKNKWKQNLDSEKKVRLVYLQSHIQNNHPTFDKYIKQIYWKQIVFIKIEIAQFLQDQKLFQKLFHRISTDQMYLPKQYYQIFLQKICLQIKFVPQNYQIVFNCLVSLFSSSQQLEKKIFSIFFLEAEENNLSKKINFYSISLIKWFYQKYFPLKLKKYVNLSNINMVNCYFILNLNDKIVEKQVGQKYIKNYLIKYSFDHFSMTSNPLEFIRTKSNTKLFDSKYKLLRNILNVLNKQYESVEKLISNLNLNQPKQLKIKIQGSLYAERVTLVNYVFEILNKIKSNTQFMAHHFASTFITSLFSNIINFTQSEVCTPEEFYYIMSKTISIYFFSSHLLDIFQRGFINYEKDINPINTLILYSEMPIIKYQHHIMNYIDIFYLNCSINQLLKIYCLIQNPSNKCRKFLSLQLDKFKKQKINQIYIIYMSIFEPILYQQYIRSSFLKLDIKNQLEVLKSRRSHIYGMQMKFYDISSNKLINNADQMIIEKILSSVPKKENSQNQIFTQKQQRLFKQKSLFNKAKSLE